MSLSASFPTLGCDCRREILAFDGALNDSAVRAMTILNAVCMHEVDDGIA